MGCSEVWEFKDVLTGLESVKPKLGRGNGSYYQSHFSDLGYVGAAVTTRRAARDVVARIKKAGDFILANTLEIWDRQDNPRAACKTYFFFKDEASWLVFKTYLVGTPVEFTEDNGRAYQKPSVYLFTRYKYRTRKAA